MASAHIGLSAQYIDKMHLVIIRLLSGLMSEEHKQANQCEAGPRNSDKQNEQHVQPPPCITADLLKLDQIISHDCYFLLFDHSGKSDLLQK